MLVKRIDEGKGIVATYNSTNILKSVYDDKNLSLYIIFQKGNMYMYSPVSEELYKEFESGESQGKIFISKIKNNKKITVTKITKLKEFELDLMK